MEKLINILLLLFSVQTVSAQAQDSLPPGTRPAESIPMDTTQPQQQADSLSGATETNLPVFTDSVSYRDTLIRKVEGRQDTLVRRKLHSPRKATIRSAIVPGWGQIYNGKAWKVPLVYAAIGIPVYLFFDNKEWYNRTRYALSIVANDRYNNLDSMARLHPQLRTLVEREAEGSLINYRNQFRRNMDYSVLFTLLMWGLNVVDATVDGHLKGFDVSDELTLRLKPSMIAGTGPGLSLVLHFK